MNGDIMNFEEKKKYTKRLFKVMEKQRYKIIIDYMDFLQEMKNSDYNPSDDALGNLKSSVKMGINPLDGVAIRMSDKFSRFQSFIKDGILEVEDETVGDTLIDLANYSLLFLLLFNEENSSDFISKLESRM